MLDKILKLIPLSGAVLVFCGILKLIFYYSYFNIHIVDYLEFQEIITLFLGDVNIIVVFIMLMMLISLVMLNSLKKISNLHLEEFLDKFLKFVYLYRYKYFFMFLAILIVLFVLIYFNIFSYSYPLIYIMSFCVVQMFTYLCLIKKDDGEIDIPEVLMIFILGLSLSFSIYLFSKKDIQDALVYRTETKIGWKKGIIQCDRDTRNLFIGKTNKFVFIKIDSSKSTIVIPIDEVDEYEFK